MTSAKFFFFWFLPWATKCLELQFKQYIAKKILNGKMLDLTFKRIQFLNNLPSYIIVSFTHPSFFLFILSGQITTSSTISLMSKLLFPSATLSVSVFPHFRGKSCSFSGKSTDVPELGRSLRGSTKSTSLLSKSEKVQALKSTQVRE